MGNGGSSSLARYAFAVRFAVLREGVSVPAVMVSQVTYSSANLVFSPDSTQARRPPARAQVSCCAMRGADTTVRSTNAIATRFLVLTKRLAPLPATYGARKADRNPAWYGLQSYLPTNEHTPKSNFAET
eukprot:2414251-Rhodomonas_salina.2